MESDTFGGCADRHIALGYLLRGHIDPPADQIFKRGGIDHALKASAAFTFAESRRTCNVRQSNVPAIFFMYEFQHFLMRSSSTEEVPPLSSRNFLQFCTGAATAFPDNSGSPVRTHSPYLLPGPGSCADRSGSAGASSRQVTKNIFQLRTFEHRQYIFVFDDHLIRTAQHKTDRTARNTSLYPASAAGSTYASRSS